MFIFGKELEVFDWFISSSVYISLFHLLFLPFQFKDTKIILDFSLLIILPLDLSSTDHYSKF